MSLTAKKLKNPGDLLRSGNDPHSISHSARARAPARAARRRKPSRRPVAGPLKALVGPRTLQQALDRAVSPRRRREIAEQSGYDAQAQKLTFEPYLRALVVRQLMGGTLHDLQHGMAYDPLYEAHGARLEISVPACPRPTPSARSKRLGRGGGGNGDDRCPAADRADWARQALGRGHPQGVTGDRPTAGADADF